MRVDDDGYFYFRGRKKQIIVHDGSNISPQEIEGVLVEHESVESAAVIGIHDLVHGENVRAYITFKEGADRPTSQELIRFARSKVGYKAPEEIVVLDRMPFTATGKVDRTGLKRMAEANLTARQAARSLQLGDVHVALGDARLRPVLREHVISIFDTCSPDCPNSPVTTSGSASWPRRWAG
jgi:acyl-CoA synthetase (AMP-forming)/AMP-acid ligase II